ncbi:MAG: sulfurtransferase-like selenium metabolism protein YedF [Bilophila wadsworthia]
MTKELNCCGLACPEPVIRCRRMLEEEKPASLRVLVDNTAASENVGRFLGRTDYSVEVRQEGADLWCVSATACGCRVTEPEPAAATLTPGKTLVLITTETFGRGDDELGEKLMGNFLSTLPELGEPVARHSAERRREARRHPRKALDSLKALENAGTDVLVCGTCLDFYGLLEAKQAGQTTNMLDVVTSLALADKVIRP